MFDFGESQNKTRKTYSIFASFVMCCLGTSLMISALATKFWFQSGCMQGGLESSRSDVYFGLFAGRNSLWGLSLIQYDTRIVCVESDCMFSCARTADLRRQHLELVKEGKGKDFVTGNCDILTDVTVKKERTKVLTVPRILLNGLHNHEEFELIRDDLSAVDSNAISTTESSVTSTTSGNLSTTPEVPHDPEFMSYGLWVGTISCLAIGMVFAVVGALFAVINTATTPVEFITGVPGLYIWNSMAALFNLICVILWAVQFHQHLTKNVLLYDAEAGWTTEGMEVFGYSYWLVVVAIIVHIANIVIIFVGTYERKIKEEVRKPEEKSVNLMLY